MSNLDTPKLNTPKFSLKRRASTVALLCSSVLGFLIPGPTQAQALNWKIGDRITLPPLELLNGSPVDWNDFKGKVLVIELWASWCPFCARQNPVLDRFYRENRSRGLEVVTVSVDRTKQAAVDYMKKGGYAFYAGMASAAWHELYKERRGLPQLFVIDRSGRLVAIEVRELMEEDIREIAKYL